MFFFPGQLSTLNDPKTILISNSVNGVKLANYLNPLTLQVTRAAPWPQGVHHRLTVEVAEAVAMTTMAAVPGTGTAAATVTPAVAATLTPLAAESEWADRSGGPPPRLIEATPLAIRTAAPAVERPEEAGAEAAAWIGEWPAADTEKEGARPMRASQAARKQCP